MSEASSTSQHLRGSDRGKLLDCGSILTTRSNPNPRPQSAIVTPPVATARGSDSYHELFSQNFSDRSYLGWDGLVRDGGDRAG